MPAEGEPAPDFTLPDQDGEDVTLSDLRGRPVVLYFYPKADTPGCTTQACGILLADEDHAICDLYGVWAEKSMYGRTYWGALRATFVIDPDGNVAKVFPKVSPKTHDEVVLKALGDLAAA